MVIVFIYSQLNVKTVLSQTIQLSLSTVLMSKTFLLQVIQFNQTVLIQTIQFSIGIVFIYTQLNDKKVLFQTIQFSINTHFSSILPTDRTLSGATTPGQSGPGCNGTEGVLRIPPKFQHFWDLTIRLFNVIPRKLVGWGGLTPLQTCSLCILQPQPTWQ